MTKFIELHDGIMIDIDAIVELSMGHSGWRQGKWCTKSALEGGSRAWSDEDADIIRQALIKKEDTPNPSCGFVCAYCGAPNTKEL